MTNPNTVVVHLKSGEEVYRARVLIVIDSLKYLKEATSPVAFIEIVQACRNPQHPLFGDSGLILKKIGLIKDYHYRTNRADIAPDIAAIVRAAVVGNGGNMQIVNPVAP